MFTQFGDRGEAVRDVQQALKDAGFDIEADGIFGKLTLAAVKQFQQKKGLDVDGIVGSDTLRALGLAGENASVDWPAIKREVVRIAKHEFEVVWDRGRKKELETSVRSVLLDYYEMGVGMSREAILDELHQRVSAKDDAFEGLPAPLQALARKDTQVLTEAEKDELFSNVWFGKVPWSAVFISWVMEKAGAGDKFRNARAHWRYLKAAKANRIASSPDNPIWAFQIDEVAPEEGDIIIKSRGGSKATWDDFDSKVTHGDIVVEVQQDKVVVIGGNVGSTVGSRDIALSADGKIKSTGGGNNDHFAVVRIVPL